MLGVISIENSPINSVCHLLFDELSRRCVIIDPGSEEPSEIDEVIVCHDFHLEYIVLTHEHFDHVWGCNYFINKYKCPIICSPYCAEAIVTPKKNLSVFYNPEKAFSIQPISLIIIERDMDMEWSGHKIGFKLAGGHSSGGILMIANKYIFTGDTLVKDLKTVTKLKNGSRDKLKESISYLRNLQGEGYTIYPGHGENFSLDTYNLDIALYGPRK